jgi:hypothetical protein
MLTQRPPDGQPKAVRTATVATSEATILSSPSTTSSSMHAEKAKWTQWLLRMTQA